MPTDDPTDPPETPARRRVSGAQLLDALNTLPDRIAERLDGHHAEPDGDDDAEPDTGDLPPEVTFTPEPEPTPEQIEDTPPPTATSSDTGTVARRSGFPRRKR